jgi:hypothetical protein
MGRAYLLRRPAMRDWACGGNSEGSKVRGSSRIILFILLGSWRWWFRGGRDRLEGEEAANRCKQRERIGGGG